jgi:PAS domain S-box-containing protein
MSASRTTRRPSERLPEITELLTFIVASDEQSLSRAAATLHVSGAAVAKRLDNLEAVLGRKLLQRGNRGVRLTEPGRDLYLRAERLVADAKALLDRTRPGTGPKLAGIEALLKRPAARSPEALAAELERLLERVFDTVSLGIIVQRIPGGVFLEVNAALCAMLEYPREALIGHSSVDLGLWESVDAREEAYAQLAEAGRAACTLLTRSGAPLAVDIVFERMTVANHDLALTFVSDVTREDALEQRLRTGDRRSALLLELAEMVLDRRRSDTVLTAALRAVKAELRVSEVAVVVFRKGSERGQVLSALGSSERLGEIAQRHRQVWEAAEEVPVDLEAATDPDDKRRRPRRATGIKIPGPRAELRVLLTRDGVGATLGSDDGTFLRSIARMIMRVLDAPAG